MAEAWRFGSWREAILFKASSGFWASSWGEFCSSAFRIDVLWLLYIYSFLSICFFLANLFFVFFFKLFIIFIWLHYLPFPMQSNSEGKRSKTVVHIYLDYCLTVWRRQLIISIKSNNYFFLFDYRRRNDNLGDVLVQWKIIIRMLIPQEFSDSFHKC